MQLRKKLYTPIWRDPVYLAKQRDRRFRVVLAVLSAACLMCLFVPDSLNYHRAISLQFAEGGLSARALFGCMFATLVYLAVRLWKLKHRSASIAAVVMTTALAAIALTHPASDTHNVVFITMSILICFSHAAIFYEHMDAKLGLTAAGALAGLFSLPFSLGVGERVLVASTCVALNVLYYEHLDP